MIVARSLSVALVAVVLGAPLSAQETSLERYVREGLEANISLSEREIATRQAEALWDQSRANYLPSLQVEARYSVAEGGRTFDVPVGDLLNPAYGALNGLTGSSDFPTIENQRFPLLREREQDTRLRLTQILWNPAVRADARSKRLQFDATQAGTDAARRSLARDIRIAYYTYANATRAEAILDDAFDLVEENERSTNALWQTSMGTRDQVHRARAERLDVETQRARAETDRQLAASYFNYLIGRPSTAPIELDTGDLALPTQGRLGSLRQAATAPLDGWVQTLAEQAVQTRPELEQLDHAVAAAEAGLGAVRAGTRPTVALALDAGIQGRGYGFDGEHRYLLASLVMSWSVTNGGGERAQTRRASLEHDRLQRRRADAAALIRLELESAALHAKVALTNLTTTRERVQEAEDAFTLVRRRRDEGLATPLEFFDARASLTRAQQSESISETDALIRLAELDFALGGSGEIALPRADQEPEGDR